MIPIEEAAMNRIMLFGPSTPIEVITSPRVSPLLSSPLATVIPFEIVDAASIRQKLYSGTDAMSILKIDRC